MVDEIRIYVEGGGETKDKKRSIRIGFGKFLERLGNKARERHISWKIIACGPRNTAYDNFLTALDNHPEAFIILLVDSEGPVEPGDGAWRHLCHVDEHWKLKDPGLNDEHYHLMVQMMEAWFIADLDAMSRFYGQGFNEKAIPPTENVEDIDKQILKSSLNTATRNTNKGKYHKIKHGAELLQRIDPDKACARASRCRRLFTTLEGKLDTRL